MRRLVFRSVALTCTLAAPLAQSDTVGPQGRWQRACWPAELEMMATEVATFGESTVKIRRDYTVQDRCAQADFTLDLEGAYRVGAPVPGVAGARQLDMTWTLVTLTPNHVEAASAFNELSVCDLRDWQPGVGKNVSGRTCHGLATPRVGGTFYQIFTIEDGRYVTGDYASPANDGSSPDKRPVTLKRDAPFVRLGS